MNDYKTGQPAYMEFPGKNGYMIKGVYFVVSDDKYYIEIHDEETMQIISKRSIKTYETDRSRWPKECLPDN